MKVLCLVSITTVILLAILDQHAKVTSCIIGNQYQKHIKKKNQPNGTSNRVCCVIVINLLNLPKPSSFFTQKNPKKKKNPIK